MMTAIQHFLAMGGYGFFVWCAYGFTFFVLFFNALLSLNYWKKIKKQIKL